MRKISVPAVANLDSTVDEKWMFVREPGHWYCKSADFALEGLKGNGRCLVVGSPLFEVLELQAKGWDVTFVDVRKPPIGGFKFLQGDASSLVLPEGFDAASSSCVLCHAGLGRYGDHIVEDADRKIMQNIYKSLKKGGRAAITVGCIAKIPETLQVGQGFRVWNREGARSLMKGFKILKEKIYDCVEGCWVKEPGTVLNRYYFSMLLEK